MSASPGRLRHLPGRANTSICRCALSRQVSLSMRVEFSAGRSKIGSTLLSKVAECQWRKNCESGKGGKMSQRPEPQEEPQVSACGRQAHTRSQRARPGSLRLRSRQAGWQEGPAKARSYKESEEETHRQECLCHSQSLGLA